MVPIPAPHQSAHQQHPVQHGHPHAQVTQAPPVQSQLVNRSEGVPAPAPERKREKRILKIVDPSTGNLLSIKNLPCSTYICRMKPDIVLCNSI